MKRKNIFKSLLAAAMALIMIFGAAPLSGFVGIRLPMLSLKAEAAITEDGLFEYEVEKKWTGSEYEYGVRITRCDKNVSGKVVVPETIEGYEVKWIGGVYSYTWAFQGCTGITSIVIPDSVISIGYSAFGYCKSLTEITIPDSVTEIGNSAFDYCTSLSKVQLPNSLTKIGNYAFRRCENLTEITIPDSVTYIGEEAFYGCKSLTEITVSPDNKNYVSVDGVLFTQNMSTLVAYPAGNKRSTYIVPDSVTEIGNSAFYRCTSLSKVKLSNGLTKIGDIAFRDCKSLKEITIPDSVTEIGNYAFDYCTSLSKVKLSNGLTKIGDSAFSDCKNLTEITIPDSVTEIGDDAFYYCTSLSKVKLPNSLTKIGYSAFRGCINLTDITISSDNKNFSSVDGVLFSKDMSTLLVYPAGNECSTYIVPDSVTEIGYSAFYRCTSLSKVQLPNGLTKIGGSVFAYCKSLKELTIPDGVTEIGSSAFDNCTSLSKVKLPNSLTKIGDSTFSDCKNLTEITIPDSVTEIGGGAFSSCSSLVDITVSPDNKNYVSVDGVLFSKDMSALLVYPRGNKRSTYTVPDGVTKIGDSAFYYCTSLTEITIPDSVTQIGSSAFSGCTSLKELTIPDSVISIGGYAFSSCTSLAKITVSPDNKNYSSVDGVLFNKDGSELIVYPKGNKRSTYTVPDGVTQIGGSTFSGCTSLTKITIPDSVISIDGSAFSGCTSIAEITVSPDNKNYVSVDGVLFSKDMSALLVYPKGNKRSTYTVPDSVTKIDDAAFFGCVYLTDITVSSDNKNYISVDGVLFTKNMSTLVAYPAGNERSTYTIPYGVKKICAFAYCENLKEIVFPDSVIDVSSEPFIVGCCSLTNIVVSPGNNIFWSADGVLFANTEANFLVTYPAAKERSTYTIPDGVEIIYAEAFAHSKNLKSVTISESVTAIYESAFMCCTSLREITIPKSVIEIDDSAFENCDSLKNVYYLGTRAQWKAVVIGTKNEALTRATVHCIDDPPCDHVWGEWEVVEEATYEKEGLERRACSRCNIEETRVIPKLVRASAIELSESEKTVFVGDTFTITATVKPEDAFNRTVTWSSSDPSIATVDENGTVTAIAKGEAIITAESADGVKAECKVTVEKKVAAIELSESEKTVFVGDTFTITATVKPEDAFNRTVTWSSSDPSIATVDENGTVTAIAKGEAIITAESADGVKAECKVTVEKKVAAIELSESEKTVFVGDTFTITATVKPEDAFNRTVTWSSSDPSIATVDENGTVTAIAKGEAIITAESADGVKAECKVTVEKKVAAIELSESEKTVFVGDTFTITATVKPEDAFNRTVTWSSSDPSIATVDENGTVTAIAKGEAIITAESADGVKAECKVTVEKKDGFFKTLLKIITAPFRAIINLFKKLFGK